MVQRVADRGVHVGQTREGGFRIDTASTRRKIDIDQLVASKDGSGSTIAIERDYAGVVHWARSLGTRESMKHPLVAQKTPDKNTRIFKGFRPWARGGPQSFRFITGQS